MTSRPLDLFLESTRQNLDRLHQEWGLLAQGKEGTTYRLLVAAHSLKAIARAAHWSDLMALTHRLEDVLKQIEEQGGSLGPLERVLAHLDLYCTCLEEQQTVPLDWLPQGERLLARWENTLDANRPLSHPDLIGPVLLTLDRQLKAGNTLDLAQPLADLAQTAQASAAEPWVTLGGLVYRATIANPPLLWPHVAGLALADFYYARELQQIQALAEFELSPELKRLAAPAPPQHPERNRDLVREQLLALEERSQTVQAALRDFLLQHSLGSDLASLENLLQQLDLHICSLRSITVGQWLGGWSEALQSMARRADKPVGLKIQGERILIDRDLARRLHAPLWHLLCNAIDHGLEYPEERRQKGKSPVGQVLIQVLDHQDQWIWEVEDDGQGINSAELYRQAVTQGLIPATTTLEEAQQLALIFSPGLSTTGQLNTASGRGVGLSGVQQALAELNGSIHVSSQPDVGTRFTIKVPKPQTAP